MAIKFVSKNAPADRRPMTLDPATSSTIAILPGMVLFENASKYATKASSAALVGGPVFAFNQSDRKDVQGQPSGQQAITVVDGPFVADINTDGYTGSPALHDLLSPGATAGKLATQTVTTGDCSTLQKGVAYCTRTADADGFIRVKVIR